jgi:hypothetical protein
LAHRKYVCRAAQAAEVGLKSRLMILRDRENDGHLNKVAVVLPAVTSRSAIFFQSARETPLNAERNRLSL